MNRFLFDHNTNEDVLLAWRAADPQALVSTARELGLARMPDDAILQWAAETNHVVVTQDRNTPVGVAEKLRRELRRMAGVIVLEMRKMPPGEAGAQLALLSGPSREDDFKGEIFLVP